MDHNQTETTIVSSNATKSLFYCSHAPRLIWDVHDTISPWIFAAVASIISPAAVLLNALVIIAVTKRRELQKPSNILLSSMAVTDLLVGAISIPLSARWILTSLSNCCYSTYLHARRGNSVVVTHSDILFAVPSGADCMGEIRGHSKMEVPQRYTD